MSINIGPPSVEELRPRITVIGVGGAGGNAIANMIQAEIEGVDFIVANTDAQALNSSVAEHRIQLGPDITSGLGAGSRPEVGRAAAEETVEEIERALEGCNMVFIAAGMGGGTGTGAAPVIAEIARGKGILTVGVVTKPFLFEGTRRMRAAESGIEELQKSVDTLLVIPNQNLFLVAKAETTFKEAFQLADEVLQQGVRSITDLMVMPGLINLDFADVRSVMGEMGKAMMGTGEGEGANRALEAAERAIANPLLDGVSMTGAKGVIISIIGGEDMKLLEVDEAANHIRELVDPEANIIWGSAFNPALEGKIRVSVVATGIESSDQGSGSGQTSNFGASRAAKKPVLPLPTEQERAGDSVAAPFGGADFAQPARFDDEFASEDAPRPGSDSGFFGAARMPEPYDGGDEGEDALAEPAQDSDFGPGTESGYASLTRARIDRDLEGASAEGGDWNDEPGEDGEALELTLEADEDGRSSAGEEDELLLDASRLAEANDTVQPGTPGRRQRILGAATDERGETQAEGESAAGQPQPQRRSAPAAAPTGGSTLFERMANLSRAHPEEEEEEEESGGSLRIPRFLGRQNNQ